MKPDAARNFQWPNPVGSPPTVGEVLRDLMAADGWPGADAWAARANGIGPTLVGGSRKHGGPDLGPTRAREAWLKLGVDGKGLADSAPRRDHALEHVPLLTVEMAAASQGSRPDGSSPAARTAAYRQVGNAFPPVAHSVGISMRAAIEAARGTSSARAERLLRAV